MDFAKLKSEAMKLKDKAKQASKSAVDYSAGKLADSKMTLKSIEEIEKFIEKSKSSTIKDKNSGKEKIFCRRVIILFLNTNSEFFKEMLYVLPVLQAKAFSQNISLKLGDKNIKNLDTKKYQIVGDQTLVVFENMKVVKVITQKDQIQNVVKQASLDINKSIDQM